MAVPAGTERIVKRNPATLELVGELDCTPIDDIPIIIQKVRAAQAEWAARPLEERRRTLKRLQEHVSSNIDASPGWCAKRPASRAWRRSTPT